MRDLDLLGEYLVRLRQEKLQHGHQLALQDDPSLLCIQVSAREAELCNRIRDAVKVLASDPGKFIQEFLP
jgi:hypothetical protein